jgi:hypothetical protein
MRIGSEAPKRRAHIVRAFLWTTRSPRFDTHLCEQVSTQIRNPESQKSRSKTQIFLQT